MTAKSAPKTDKKLPADYVKEGNGHSDITLSRPATIAGAPVTTLRMREPTVADMEAFQNSSDSESTREIATFANLCEVSPDDIRALPFKDYTRLQAAFALFTS